MVGRQVITTNKAFSLDELYEFMSEHWDKEAYNDFIVGKPTPASIEKYILLPASQRFCVCVYSRKGGKLFSKDNKVILITADNAAGLKTKLYQSVPTHNIFFGIAKMSSSMSQEKERKGPAEEILQRYTAYMKQLLDSAGYTK